MCPLVQVLENQALVLLLILAMYFKATKHRKMQQNIYFWVCTDVSSDPYSLVLLMIPKQQKFYINENDKGPSINTDITVIKKKYSLPKLGLNILIRKGGGSQMRFHK